ncbi:Mitochondrial inner membrane protease subunit 2 [Smittium mucronatum]|uniref:Mitochondrial inner membrane protease subunit n=1 Tax=Smittium mucronatum TaxID=133383 RepID=A0A1R0H2M6_9FUNG|nr:Mitochondrial inner membrane protease subunit 2 [Smittium mucronatum]
MLKRGDVVTLHSPTNPSDVLVKRIIGLPGDMIRPLKNTPQHADNHQNLPDRLQIPSGHCWVEGDEGFHSIDSNSFGYVPLGLVIGRASFVVYPFSNFGPVKSRIPDWKRDRINQ